MATKEEFLLMLTQLYDKLEDNEDDILSSKKIPLPKLKMFPRKVHWINYYDIIRVMNRDFNHFQGYIQNELAISTSLKNVMNVKEGLILHTKCRDKQLKSLIGKYFTKYISCKSCSSDDTTMEKMKGVAKLYQIKCNKCLATFNVA